MKRKLGLLVGWLVFGVWETAGVVRRYFCTPAYAMNQDSQVSID